MKLINIEKNKIVYLDKDVYSLNPNEIIEIGFLDYKSLKRLRDFYKSNGLRVIPENTYEKQYIKDLYEDLLYDDTDGKVVKPQKEFIEINSEDEPTSGNEDDSSQEDSGQ